MVIIIEPVIETYGTRDFGAWPVGASPDDGFLVLSGDLAPADVGTAMAAIAAYNSSIIPDGEEDAPPGPATTQPCGSSASATRSGSGPTAE